MWENEVTVNGRKINMMKATVERRYRSKDGEWKSSGSFSRNEIPLVQWCLDKAFTAMIEEQSTADEKVDEEQVE